MVSAIRRTEWGSASVPKPRARYRAWEGTRPAFQPMDVGGDVRIRMAAYWVVPAFHDVPEQFLYRRCQPPGGPGRARWRSGRAGARTEVHAERPCWFWSDANTCRDPWASVYPQPISTGLQSCSQEDSVRLRTECGTLAVPAFPRGAGPLPWVPVPARKVQARRNQSGRPDARPQSDTHDPVLDFVRFRITGRQASEPPFENTTGPSSDGTIPAVAAGSGSVCTFPFKTDEIRLPTVGRPFPQECPGRRQWSRGCAPFRKSKELPP